MLHAIVTFAAEAAGHETSKTAFYVTGGVLALWAVLVAAIGIVRYDRWPDAGASRAVMGVSAVLVAATMATSILTS